jgi:hypothetical protein
MIALITSNIKMFRIICEIIAILHFFYSTKQIKKQKQKIIYLQKIQQKQMNIAKINDAFLQNSLKNEHEYKNAATLIQQAQIKIKNEEEYFKKLNELYENFQK